MAPNTLYHRFNQKLEMQSVGSEIESDPYGISPMRSNLSSPYLDLQTRLQKERIPEDCWLVYLIERLEKRREVSMWADHLHRFLLKYCRSLYERESRFQTKYFW